MFYLNTITFIILVMTSLLHEFCSTKPKKQKLSLEEIDKIRIECLKKVYEEFTDIPDVVIHARHAILNLKLGASCLNEFTTEYYDSFYRHLDAQKIPSVTDFCEEYPENEREMCKYKIKRFFESATNRLLYEDDKKQLLVIAFYNFVIKDAEKAGNTYAVDYIDKITKKVQIKMEIEEEIPVIFKAPEEFCDEYSKQRAKNLFRAERGSSSKASV